MKCAVITLILLTAAILPVSCQSTNKKINKVTTQHPYGHE